MGRSVMGGVRPREDGGGKGSPPTEGRWEGESLLHWARWWGIPRFEVFRSLPSTNDWLRGLSEIEAMTVVVAEAQTEGRGREGREWHSPPGLGLWASVALEVEDGSTLPVLPLRVGLALAEAIEVAAPPVRPALKWPNDVLIGGRKVAGILCETSRGGGGGGGWVVAGVGVNIRQEGADFPVELRRGATSLLQGAGWVPDRAMLLGAFLSRLRDRLAGVQSGGLSEGELEAWAARDHLRGRRVRVDPGGEGVARGVDAGGALLVEEGGRIRRVTAGTVRTVDTSP